jgi:hypothetical protein
MSVDAFKERAAMKKPLERKLTAATMLTLGIAMLAAPAGADPINDKTTVFTARCSGLGEITAVAVLFPTPLARGGTSAFQVLGSNTVLIWYARGTDNVANRAGTSCDITSINGEPVSGTVSTLIVGGPVGLWNPAVDWKNVPGQANPSPDSYGNPNVWRYMASSGFDHDPDNYQLLPNYQAAGEQWNDPGYVNLLVEHSSPISATLFMHSYGGRVVGWGRNSTVAWTSPVNGRLRVDGSVQLAPVSECPSGSGIIWSVYQDARPVSQSVLAAGEGASFAFSTTVQKGQTLYFVHDAGWDSNCDGAVVQLQITKP